MNRTRFLALILLLLLCFTACGNQVLSAVGEYEFLDGASIPSSYSVTENPEGGYLICQGQKQVGGIQLLDLTEARKSDDFLYHLSDHLIAAAKEVAKQHNPTEYDYIYTPDAIAYLEINLASTDGAEYGHYILETVSGYCDLWFDLSRVTYAEATRFIGELFS